MPPLSFPCAMCEEQLQTLIMLHCHQKTHSKDELSLALLSLRGFLHSNANLNHNWPVTFLEGTGNISNVELCEGSDVRTDDESDNLGRSLNLQGHRSGAGIQVEAQCIISEDMNKSIGVLDTKAFLESINTSEENDMYEGRISDSCDWDGNDNETKHYRDLDASDESEKLEIPSADKDTNSSVNLEHEPDKHQCEEERTKVDVSPELPSDEVGTCYMCGKKFENIRSLKKHQVACRKAKYSCKMCGRSFLSEQRFLMHQVKEHNIGEKPFKCDKCGRRCLMKHQLQLHMQTHKEQRERPYSCEVCGYACYMRGNLKSHMKIHVREKSYNCDICGEAFFFRVQLSTHYRTHGMEPLPKKTTKEWKCKECGKAFATKGNLNGHFLIHTGEKPYSCKKCGEKFTYARALQTHVANIHMTTKPFICEICGKDFPFQTYLKNHLMRHSGERPFPCPHCDKAFPLLAGLSRHMLVHSGKKPHMCEVCGRAFSQKGALKTHYRIHTGEKPFRCSYCDFTCAHAATIKKHTQNTHGNCSL